MNESCVLTNLILSTKITPFWGSSQAKTYLFYKLFPLILATPSKSSFCLITLYAAHDNVSHESNAQMILANQRWTPFLECKYHHKCGGNFQQQSTLFILIISNTADLKRRLCFCNFYICENWSPTLLFAHHHHQRVLFSHFYDAAGVYVSRTVAHSSCHPIAH